MSERTAKPTAGRLRPLYAVFLVLSACLALLFAPVAVARTYSDQELALLTLINDYRQQHGVAPLQLSDMLSQASAWHNSDMATYGRNTPSAHFTLASDYFPAGSAPWDRMAICGYDYNTWMAENIAFGASTAQIAFNAWCASSIHEPHMIDYHYEVIGISCLYVPGSQYLYYWTTDFGGYADPTAHNPFAPGTTTTTTAPPTTPTTSTTSTTPTTSTTTTSTTTTSQTTTTTLPGPHFRDVPSDDPYYEAVTGLLQRGVVQGFRVGGLWEFGRDQEVNRAQFAKMVCGALDIPVSETLTCSFTDVGPDLPTDLYPHDFVAAAANAGITLGVGNGAYAPWSPICRAQVVTMMIRGAQMYAAGALRIPPAGFVSAVPHSGVALHDTNMKIAERSGLLEGIEGLGENWDPWAPATRGEVAQMLWKVALAAP